jgi:hypothetical protein
LLLLAILSILGACGSNDQYLAPYAAVTDADAPTVASLEAGGFQQVDYYPVGCELPECPDCACDANGAVFMDRSEIYDESFDIYEFVCPAIEGAELPQWKCRRQEESNV